MDARRLAFGFAAGALAVPVFHQGMILLLHLLGFTPNFPWSFRPAGAFGVPALLNSMFWGGVWGAVFALVKDRIPVSGDLARGAAFGLLGPWLLGNGLLVPLIKGGPLLFGFAPVRMMVGALIGAAFGVGLALFWRLLASRARLA